MKSICFTLIIASCCLSVLSYAQEEPGRSILAPGQGNAFLSTSGHWSYQWSGVTVSLRSVSFSDDLTGTVVGDGGTILRTTDGGLHWLPQTSGVTAALRSVACIDANMGVAVGDNGTILRTTNGGTSWIGQQSGTTNALRSLAFDGAEVAVAVGSEGTILRTTNGGSHWTKISTGSTARLTSVAFADANIGMIVGWGGTAFRTTDAGGHWVAQSLPHPYTSWCGIAFAGVENIAVIGRERGESTLFPGEYLHSTDGGLNWTTAAPLGSFDYDDTTATILYPNPQTLYMTIESWLRMSSDNGASWTSGNEVHVRFLGSSSTGAGTVTLVGDSGLIVRTADPRWPMAPLEMIAPAQNGENIPLVFTRDADGDTIMGALNFTWRHLQESPGRNYLHYQIQVSTDSTFSTYVFNSLAFDSIIQLSTFRMGRTYYWRVFGYSLLDRTDWSPVWKFSAAPSPFTEAQQLASPGNGITLDLDIGYSQTLYQTIENAVQCRWHTYPSYADPVGFVFPPFYKFQLATDSTFASGMIVDKAYPAGDTSDIFPNLEFSTKYYWRVSPVFSFMDLHWSPTWSFTTSPLLRQYPPLVCTAPVQGSTVEVTARPNENPTVAVNWLSYPPRIEYDGSSEAPTFLYVAFRSLDQVRAYDWGTPFEQWDSTGGRMPLYSCVFGEIFWKVRAVYSIGASPWTDVKSFRGVFPSSTAGEIQHIDTDSLLLADALQQTDGYSLQRSRKNDSLFTSIFRCVVPPGILTRDGPMAVIADTDQINQPWHQILAPVYPGDYNTLDRLGIYSIYHGYVRAFASLHQGDIVSLTGFVGETPESTVMSNTIFQSIISNVLGNSPCSLTPVEVSLSDFYQGEQIRFSSGEQYEGLYVELRDVTVHAILDSSQGIFDMIDNGGNILRMSDLSKWFTCGAHREIGCGYAIPQPGRHINFIRGIIVTENDRYCIAPVFPGDLDLAPPSGRVIHATVFQDREKDGARNHQDIPMAGYRVMLTGRAELTLYTDFDGSATIAGLDPGVYRIICLAESGWSHTGGIVDTTTLVFGPAEETLTLNCGLYYPWSRISGTVFNDLNENGVKDEDEPGLPNLLVTLYGPVGESIGTDSVGSYSFEYVHLGWNALGVTLREGWEQIYPYWFDSLTVIAATPEGQYTGRNFAMHRIPARTKLRLTVHDNSFGKMQSLYFGARGGATYGIYPYDAQSTVIDFAEGEFDLPPVSTPRTVGFFDARFMEPHGNNARFGEGSWTDMRDFTSPAQADTYLVAFLPGYIEGGDYPITISWNRFWVMGSYFGAVNMIDPYGSVIDMYVVDSLVITDRRIGSVRIATQGPRMPLSTRWGWYMVSMPGTTSDNSIGHLFSLAGGQAFYYEQTSGYKTSPTLLPGTGYWLKCLLTSRQEREFLSTIALPETLTVTPGWNLIGAPNAVIDAGNVQTDPAEMMLGKIFCYRDGSYQLTDSLHPYEGYWIKASRGGRIILGGNSSGGIARKNNTAATIKDLAEGAIRISLTDAAGISQQLYIASSEIIGVESSGLSQFELPPAAPFGIGDMRFASGRCLELLPPAGMVKEYPITLSANVVFPLAVTFHAPAGMREGTFSLKNGTTMVPLKDNTPMMFSSRSAALSLRVQGGQYAALPKEFRLEQNYPNPFNPTTTINYALPVESKVHLCVYDVLGREVAQLVNQVQPAGYQTVAWDASNASSGVYFYRMNAVSTKETARSFGQVRKLIVVK